jgi:hypothetical protein
MYGIDGDVLARETLGATEAMLIADGFLGTWLLLPAGHDDHVAELLAGRISPIQAANANLGGAQAGDLVD